MPKVDVDEKRGYEASVPVKKIWNKIESGMIDDEVCIPLGESEGRKDESVDLLKCGHILAAGAALSGVGMFRRVALATLLKFNKPEDLKFILIDPLKVSFFYFKNIDKYLVFPIIRENAEAIKTLEWLNDEMERRYEILVENKVPNMKRYNEENPDKKIPRIVVMITELGELIDFDGKKTEGLYIRIAQMQKAVGIHFMINTQRPSDQIITSLIKANVPMKIAFQSGSEEGSVSILGIEGAEKLLGQGDMLAVRHDKEIERMQGYCLEEEEVECMTF